MIIGHRFLGTPQFTDTLTIGASKFNGTPRSSFILEHESIFILARRRASSLLMSAIEMQDDQLSTTNN